MYTDCTVNDIQRGDIVTLSPSTYKNPTLRVLRVEKGLPRNGVRVTWNNGHRMYSAIFSATNPARKA